VYRAHPLVLQQDLVLVLCGGEVLFNAPYYYGRPLHGHYVHKHAVVVRSNEQQCVRISTEMCSTIRLVEQKQPHPSLVILKLVQVSTHTAINQIVHSKYQVIAYNIDTQERLCVCVCVYLSVCLCACVYSLIKYNVHLLLSQS
jgi:hypothetical protein